MVLAARCYRFLPRKIELCCQSQFEIVSLKFSATDVEKIFVYVARLALLARTAYPPARYLSRVVSLFYVTGVE